MNNHPDNNGEPRRLVWMKRLKSFFGETIKSYSTDKFGKLLEYLVKNYLPILATTVVTLITIAYATFIRFTKATYTFTGAQILFGVVIAIVLLVVIFCAPRIRKVYLARHSTYEKIFDLYWRLDSKGFVGPYCPHCNEGIISETTLVETMDTILDNIFGERTNYTYLCLNCKNELTLNLPLEQVKDEAYKKILGSSKKPDR